jgi:hypothetical protein
MKLIQVDISFLEDMNRGISREKHTLKDVYQRTNRSFKLVNFAFKYNHIRLKLLPKGMQRQKQNRTSWDIRQVTNLFFKLITHSTLVKSVSFGQ